MPEIAPLGLAGRLVSFGDALTEPANRAALAFRGALEREGWEGIEETSVSLTGVYVRMDPDHPDPGSITAKVETLLADRDWYDAPMPEGRRLWTVPCVFGQGLAPQWDEARNMAGLSEEEAIRSLTEAAFRIITLGYAPGQPYIGTLPETWDLPRQKELTPKVPRSALVVAIRQLVVFANEMPTGWRHIGQTRFRPFMAEADDPFSWRPGDEVRLMPVTPEQLENVTGRGGEARPL